MRLSAALFPLLLLAAVATATGLYRSRLLRSNDAYSLLHRTLRGLEQHLPKGTNLSVLNRSGDVAVQPQTQMYVPLAHLSFPAVFAALQDTALLVVPQASWTVFRDSLRPGTRLLWAAQDSAAHFYLVVQPALR